MAYKKIILLLLFIATISLVSSLPALPSNDVYVDVNTSFPLILIPLDNNIWDIQLHTNGSSYNFTWTGTQYQLTLTFMAIGDYPFVINSTNVSGEITGTFLVRQPFYVTFRVYNQKASVIPFVSNKYINNFAYVTAEFINGNSPFNSYNPTLEKYFAPLNSVPDKYKKPVFWGQYNNGVAYVKLYNADTYAFRLIDGQISFPYSYSVPNITKSYGTNIYLGKFTMNGTNQEFNVYVSPSDIKPFRSLLNWITIGIVALVIIVGVFLLFVMPQYPSFVLITSIIIIGGTILLRIIVWFIFQ